MSKKHLIAVILSIIVAVVVLTAALAWFVIQIRQQEECVCHGDPCLPVSLYHGSGGGTSPDNRTGNLIVVNVECPFNVGFDSYEVSIIMNGTSLGQITIAESTIMSFGPNVRLIVNDIDGSGKLSAGDKFLIYGMGELHHWVFNLIWAADGSWLNQASWYT